MTADLLPLLVDAVWGGLFAAIMAVLFQAPTSALLPCFVAGLAGRLARNLLLAAGAGPHLTTFLAATLVALIASVVLLGLGSRRYAASLPVFLATYAGDTLWALAVLLGIGLLLPRASIRRVALLAMSFSVLVEASQLYKAPWIDSVRRTTLGGLVLGFDFADELADAALRGLDELAQLAHVRRLKFTLQPLHRPRDDQPGAIQDAKRPL